MKELIIVIDGTVHKYVKVHISKESCKTCSLNLYCKRGKAKDIICNLFDESGKCNPIGLYGHFEIIKNI